MNANGMIWPMLVLVEGLPGSGKSTTAQWIGHEMQSQGRPARWVYEQEEPHPVLGSVRGPSASWKDYLAARLSAWASFTAGARNSSTATVMDSTFLQSSIFSTLRRGFDPETILTYVERVADIIRPLDPALVYFLQPDPATAFRRICDARGIAWTLQHINANDGTAWARGRNVSGFDGLVAYWREHSAICDAAVGRSRLRTITVDSLSGDWPAHRRAIAEFLGLNESSGAPVPDADLQRYVGRYRRQTGPEVHVTLGRGGLVMNGLLWRGNRLLPRAPHTFVAEAWPFTLTFDVDARGAAARFRVDGPALPWANRPAGIYEKLA